MRLIPIFALICLLSTHVTYSQEISESCRDALPSRLIIGQKGLMIQNQPSDLYTEPGGQIIVNIPANSVFEVLEGPVCTENFAWWHVRYADHEGWAAEGEAGIYFLEPLTPIATYNLQQLSDVQLLGRGVFTTGLEWSSDGAKIAVGSTVGVVQFDAKNFSALSSWYDPSPNGQVCDVEYSDDGSGRWGFAICAEGSSTEIRTIDETPYAERWYAYDGEIHEFRFINGSDNLVIASENMVMLLEGGVGSQDLLWEAENRIAALDVSANGIAFAATDSKQVVLGTPLSRLATTLLDVGDVFKVTSLALNADGTLLAVGVNRQIQLWDVETKVMLAVHDNLRGGAAAQALDMKFSLKNQRLVTISDANTLTVWEVGNSDIRQVDTLDFEGYLPMTQLVLNPEGTQAAMVGLNGLNNTLFICGIPSHQPIAILSNGPTMTIRNIVFNSDSRTLASIDDGGNLRLWDVISGIEMAVLLPSNERTANSGSQMNFNPNGKLLVSITGSFAHLLDAKTGDEKFVLQHEAAVNSAIFSPDGTILATGTEDGDINFWDSATGEYLRIIQSPYGAVNALAFSPDGVWFAAATDTVVKIYRVPMMNYFGEG